MSTIFQKAIFIALAALVIPASGMTQGPGSVYSDAHVIQLARRLEADLKATPDASGIREEKLNESTQVAVRNKTGRAEFHSNAADVFLVLSGEATLISGGSIVNPTGSGEIRGDFITGGMSSVMQKGDIVYVPSATPHQVAIQPGTVFLYVVVKIPRKD